MPRLPKDRTHETVTLAEAARRLSVSKSTAYRAARAGTFPARLVTVGATIRVVAADLDRVLAAREHDDAA